MRKPVTPLPWEADCTPGYADAWINKVDTDHVICRGEHHGTTTRIGSKRAIPAMTTDDCLDLAYLAHAANMYPRLVAALTALAEHVRVNQLGASDARVCEAVEVLAAANK